MDEKSPQAFRTISEAATTLDLPQHVLRFWETRFPQIRPLKRGGGRRYYRPDDVDLLRAIKRLLYDEGYTIKGVQKMLREQGLVAVAETRSPAPPPPRSARRIEPSLSASVEIPDPVAPPHPASPPQDGPQAADAAALRAALADLREAERILAQARPD